MDKHEKKVIPRKLIEVLKSMYEETLIYVFQIQREESILNKSRD